MASNPQTPRGAFGAQLKGPGYGTLNKPEETAAEETKEKRSSESERVGMEKKYFFRVSVDLKQMPTACGRAFHFSEIVIRINMCR